LEACLERWQGRCVDFREFALAVAMASMDEGAALECIIDVALLPTSPAQLLTGATGACVSFAPSEDFIRKRDGGASWLADGARVALIRRGRAWGHRHLRERLYFPVSHGLSTISGGDELIRQAASLPHLRRTLDAVAALEKGGLDDAARDPAIIGRSRVTDVLRTGDQDLGSALEEDATSWRAAVRRARLRLLPLLDNQRLLGL
jgi:hypothetical protein